MCIVRMRVLAVSACLLFTSHVQGQELPPFLSSEIPQTPQSSAPLGFDLSNLQNVQLVSWSRPAGEDCDGVALGYGMRPSDGTDGAVKYPTVRLSGFFQVDAGWVHQSAANQAAVGDAEDGIDFRRARLMAVGDAWENVGYMVEFDFASPGRPSFMDVWLELRELHGGSKLRIGQYRQPIGMTALNSVRELTFIERPLPFALVPFRQTGAMLQGTAWDEAMSWAVSGFRFPTDFFGNNVGDDGGYGLATRVTALLVDRRDDLRVHVGGAYCFADPSQDAIRIFSQPEFFLLDTGLAALAPPSEPGGVPPFIDTGAIATQNYSVFGGELAGQFHRLYVQSEILVSVLRQLGGGTAVFPGAYVQAGYVLTGEIRPYNRQTGLFGRIVPDEPFRFGDACGAWELTARASHLDLTDSGINGGILDDLTFGVNWYLNRFTKFQFNYIHAFLDSAINGRSEADIAAVRAQVDF